MLATLRKDFSSQFATVATSSAIVISLLGILVAQRLVQGEEILPVLRTYVVWGLCPLVWLVVNRVFVGEYAGSAPGFLERLPLSPARVFASKVLLTVPLFVGLLLLGLSSVVSAGAVLRQEIPSDVVTQVFATAAGFLGCVYAVLVLGASLGRHRHVAGVVVLGGILLAWRSGVSTLDLGPLAYTRLNLLPPPPGAAARWLGLAGGLLAVAFVLHLVAHGRLARAMQRPASRREAFRVAGLVTLLALALGLTEPPATPFVLDGPVAQAEADGAQVTVRLRDPVSSQALADDTARHLALLHEHTGVALPPVSVDVEAGTTAKGPRFFERALLDGQQGVLARIGPEPPEWNPAPFRAWILHHSLDAATDGRLQRQHWRLILDGYPRWLGLREVPADLEAREELRVAAAAVALDEAGLWKDAAFVERWEATRRRVGDPLARSLARWVFAELAAAQGEAAAHDLTRAACSQRVGAFGGLGDGRDAIAPLLASPFRARLTARGDELRAAQQKALASFPQLTGPLIEVGPSSEGASPLTFTPGEGARRVALLHALASVDSSGGVPHATQRDEAPPGTRPRATTRRYPSGSRVLWTFATYVPALGCDLVTGWQEVQVP